MVQSTMSYCQRKLVNKKGHNAQRDAGKVN